MQQWPHVVCSARCIFLIMEWQRCRPSSAGHTKCPQFVEVPSNESVHCLWIPFGQNCFFYGFVHTGWESWCSGSTATPGAMLQMDFPCLGGTINKQWQCAHRSGSNFRHMEKENCGKIGTVPELDLFFFHHTWRQENPKQASVTLHHRWTLE